MRVEILIGGSVVFVRYGMPQKIWLSGSVVLLVER